MKTDYDICQLSKTKFGVLEKRIGSVSGYVVIAETRSESAARRIADAMALTQQVKAAPKDYVRVQRAANQ